MATTDVSVTGVPEMLARLDAVLARMAVAGGKGIDTLGEETVTEAKAACPVLTGRLRGSIEKQDDDDGRGPGVLVRTEVDYAGFVEFGTRNHGAAQPFMRPALEIARTSGEGQLRVAIRSGVPELNA